MYDYNKETSYLYRCKLWVPNIWRDDFVNKIKREGCYFLYKYEIVQTLQITLNIKNLLNLYIYIYCYLVESIYPTQELR